MRFRAIIFGLVLASAATAQTPRERAVEDAVARLESQVRQQPLPDGTTLGELVDRLDAESALIETLRRADQIGGLRRLGGDHVQVQYRIDGSRIRQALLDASPTPQARDTLNQFGAVLDATQFVAVGSSLPSQLPAAPRQRLEARVIEALRASSGWAKQLPDETSLREWLAQAPLQTDHEGPVTRYALRPDYRALASLMRTGEPVDELARALAAELPTTFALIIDAAPTAAAEQAITLMVPDWVGDFVRASGSAAPASTPLLTARASEAEARRQLRLAIGALTIDHRTIEDWLAEQPTRPEMLDRLLQSAQVLSTEYHADGSAVSSVAIHGRRVWDMVAP